METTNHYKNKKSWFSSSLAAQFRNKKPRRHQPCEDHNNKPKSKHRAAAAPQISFADIPPDLLLRIGAVFDGPDLWTASTVCKAWRDALRPLREAMGLLRWGKRFKHGGGGVCPNPKKALDSFLKGVARGSAAAMVDAGLMYWEMGRREEGKALYKKAAELGYPAAQCNLGIYYLEANPSKVEEAVKWFSLAAKSGYARAQYNLALCLQRGRGTQIDPLNAAKWYKRAAEGGNARAMYNLALCYSLGEGLVKNSQKARMWMEQAANCGHKKRSLNTSGEAVRALVYLELATRAGERAASHLRDVILQSLPHTLQERVMISADRWQSKQLRQ